MREKAGENLESLKPEAGVNYPGLGILRGKTKAALFGAFALGLVATWGDQAKADDCEPVQRIIENASEGDPDAPEFVSPDFYAANVLRGNADIQDVYLSMSDGLYSVPLQGGPLTQHIFGQEAPVVSFGPNDEIFGVSGGVARWDVDNNNWIAQQYAARGLEPLNPDKVLILLGEGSLLVSDVMNGDLNGVTNYIPGYNLGESGLEINKIRLDSKTDPRYIAIQLSETVDNLTSPAPIVLIREITSYDAVSGTMTISTEDLTRLVFVEKTYLQFISGRALVVIKEDLRGDGWVECLPNVLPETQQVDPCEGAGAACEYTNEHGTTTGAMTCVDGQNLVCETNTPPAADNNCDGEDNNFNGRTDEGYVGGDCEISNEFGTSTGQNVCLEGSEYCNAETPEEEVCDGIDNNKDGRIDEGCNEDNDPDSDGIPTESDNCPRAHNPNQTDLNGDGTGDACQSGSAPELGQTVITEGCVEVRDLGSLQEAGIPYEIVDGVLEVTLRPGDNIRTIRSCIEGDENFIRYKLKLEPGTVLDTIDVLEGTLVITVNGESREITTSEGMEMPLLFPDGAVLTTIGSDTIVRVNPDMMPSGEGNPCELDPQSCIGKGVTWADIAHGYRLLSTHPLSLEGQSYQAAYGNQNNSNTDNGAIVGGKFNDYTSDASGCDITNGSPKRPEMPAAVLLMLAGLVAARVRRSTRIVENA